MPTISVSRLGLKAAAALLLLGSGQATLAGGTIEFDPRFEDFASRAACEETLKRRHSEALRQIVVRGNGEEVPRQVHALERDKARNLSYAVELDLTVSTTTVTIPGSQVEVFTCRGSRLEHLIDPQPAPAP
jgi:hypothetical protein